LRRKLLIGILTVLGLAVTVVNPLGTGILAVGVWIYLVRMVRKQENGVFHNQMERKTAERHFKRLKAFLIVAGSSFLVFIVATIVHNVSDGPSETEETVSFFIALVALLVFILATAGGMAILVRARKNGAALRHL
jgi:hypothetical protein